jgi:hypothetical protein
MGFRDPLTTADAIDTGHGSQDAGVRLYQDLTVPGNPVGVAEWRTGSMDSNATIKLTGAGSGGSSYAIDGGTTQLVDAPEVDLNVEEQADGQLVPVLRLKAGAGGRIITDTAITPESGWASWISSSAWTDYDTAGSQCLVRVDGAGNVIVAGLAKLKTNFTTGASTLGNVGAGRKPLLTNVHRIIPGWTAAPGTSPAPWRRSATRSTCTGPSATTPPTARSATPRTPRSGSGSDHNPWLNNTVRALDVDVDGIDAAWLAEQLRLLGAAGDHRLTGGGYVIYNRQITSSDFRRWLPYTGADPHTSHVHVSVSRDPVGYEDRGPWHFLDVAQQPEHPGRVWAPGKDATGADAGFRAHYGDEGPKIEELQHELNEQFPGLQPPRRGRRLRRADRAGARRVLRAGRARGRDAGRRPAGRSSPPTAATSARAPPARSTGTASSERRVPVGL